MKLRRDHHGRTYSLIVCPYHGAANVGCCDRETIVIEAVPVQRVAEIEAGRDSAVCERNALRQSRQVVCVIKGATLFGSREAVAQARAYIRELQGRAAAA